MRHLLIVLLLAKCGANSDAVIGAVVMTAVAATTSKISRANGDCYAGYPTNTVCNENTGFCEVLPYRGLYSEDQACDKNKPVAKCVTKTADIVITTEKENENVPESQPPE